MPFGPHRIDRRRRSPRHHSRSRRLRMELIEFYMKCNFQIFPMRATVHWTCHCTHPLFLSAKAVRFDFSFMSRHFVPKMGCRTSGNGEFESRINLFMVITLLFAD